ncbi:hypothetical protein GCM10010320_81480 [Streptomyces caelestis]|nr:hypothetical protein GCM10010320_81480 [Streptomyces caelestis]
MPRVSERRSAAAERHADSVRFVLFEARPAGLTFAQLVRSSELSPSQARAGLACLPAGHHRRTRLAAPDLD